MVEKNDSGSGPEASGSGGGSAMQWVWLGLGALMAVIGGIIKAHDIMTSQAVFEFSFFSGAAYILLIAGLVLVILALGHDLLFAADGDDD